MCRGENPVARCSGFNNLDCDVLVSRPNDQPGQSREDKPFSLCVVSSRVSSPSVGKIVLRAFRHFGFALVYHLVHIGKQSAADLPLLGFPLRQNLAWTAHDEQSDFS